jgi:hypothetical protein
MAYSDFNLEQLVDQFQLRVVSRVLFNSVQSLSLSQWLSNTIERGGKIALTSSTEKARSEFLVAPVLLETQELSNQRVAVYSGKTLTADPSKGLNGECNFMLGEGLISPVLQAPIFSLVEAKRQDLDLCTGQCAAQMLGAQLFNQKHDRAIPAIYGCVTTGEAWQFMKLQGNELTIEPRVFYFNELDKVLWVLQTIITEVLG